MFEPEEGRGELGQGRHCHLTPVEVERAPWEKRGAAFNGEREATLNNKRLTPASEKSFAGEWHGYPYQNRHRWARREASGARENPR